MDDETDDETDDENLCDKAQDSLETVYPSFQLSFKKLGLFRVLRNSLKCTRSFFVFSLILLRYDIKLYS